MRRFTKAIEDATRFWLEQDSNFAVYGLGANYPNGLDGTHGTFGVEFGDRVKDVPISESSVTGMALGRSLAGHRTLIHHGRSEFALFAADQIFTQAAKWRYQFGGDSNVPLTLRVAMGRQWGNGPQHTASYLQFFSAVPGLKVFIPSSPNRAEALLRKALEAQDPVVFLEPRWLYQVSQAPPSEQVEQVDHLVVPGGSKLAVVSLGEGILDTVRALRLLNTDQVSVFDIWDVTPGVPERTTEDLQAFRKILFYDPYCSSGGPLIDMAAVLASRYPGTSIAILRPPNVPIPTATSLTASFYLNFQELATEISNILNEPYRMSNQLSFSDLHLPPKIKISEKWEILEF